MRIPRNLSQILKYSHKTYDQIPEIANNNEGMFCSGKGNVQPLFICQKANASCSHTRQYNNVFLLALEAVNGVDINQRVHTEIPAKEKQKPQYIHTLHTIIIIIIMFLGNNFGSREGNGDGPCVDDIMVITWLN